MESAEWGENKSQSSRRLRDNKEAGADRRADPADLGDKHSSKNPVRGPNDRSSIM